METIKNILIPVDFSDYSKAALNYAVDFAKSFNSQLHLVYVVEPMIYPADFSLGQVAIPTADVEMTNRSEEELKRLVKENIGEKIEVKTIIKSGKPFVEIIETATEIDADLIIIATHGHTGVEHLLFGSTAEKVIRKAPCPVLSLRDPIKGF